MERNETKKALAKIISAFALYPSSPAAILAGQHTYLVKFQFSDGKAKHQGQWGL